jgi:hypothetical protein
LATEEEVTDGMARQFSADDEVYRHCRIHDSGNGILCQHIHGIL